MKNSDFRTTVEPTSAITTLSTSILRERSLNLNTSFDPILAPEDEISAESENLTEPEPTSGFNQVEMWFGVVIGASIVMVMVLCALCVLYLIHKRQVPAKDLPSPEPFDLNEYINTKNYQVKTTLFFVYKIMRIRPRVSGVLSPHFLKHLSKKQSHYVAMVYRDQKILRISKNYKFSSKP